MQNHNTICYDMMVHVQMRTIEDLLERGQNLTGQMHILLLYFQIFQVSTTGFLEIYL